MEQPSKTENKPNARQTEEASGAKMEGCRHRPRFHFKTLLRTTGQFECQECAAPIRYATPFYVASKVWYYLFLAFLIFSALNSQVKTQAEMIANLLRIVAALALYLLGAYALQRFARFEFDQKEGAKREEQRAAKDVAIQEGDVAAAELSAEQKELQALYAYYEKLNAETQPQSSAEEAGVSAEPLPPPPACEHTLAPSWRNYLPGMMEFKCGKCGAKLGFKAEIKKLINLLFLLLSFAALYPMMRFETVSMTSFLLVVLGVLAAGTILQYVLIKKARLVEL